MKTYISKKLFSFYLWYIHKSPIKKGNAFLGRIASKLPPAVYSINNIKLYLNPTAYVDQSLIYNNQHDHEVNNWIDEFLRPDNFFLDIGANIGYFSLYAAKTKQCTVLAFEPSERELYRFYQNIILNQLNNIIVYPYALGNEETVGVLNLAGFQNPGQNSLLTHPKISGIISKKILIKKLNDQLPDKILKKTALIKIDVEGYEVKVLEGLQSCIHQLKNTKFIVEVTTIPGFGETDKDAELIYEFFKKNHFKPLIGYTPNTQYNELFSYEVD